MPQRHGRTMVIAQGGHGPGWHLLEHGCAHPGSDLEHVDVHVGIGSVHLVRFNRASGRKDCWEVGRSSSCFPHGQWVINNGEFKHRIDVGEGGWQALVQKWTPQSNGLCCKRSITRMKQRLLYTHCPHSLIHSNLPTQISLPSITQLISVPSPHPISFHTLPQ
jgi:hypothetical protein